MTFVSNSVIATKSLVATLHTNRQLKKLEH